MYDNRSKGIQISAFIFSTLWALSLGTLMYLGTNNTYLTKKISLGNQILKEIKSGFVYIFIISIFIITSIILISKDPNTKEANKLGINLITFSLLGIIFSGIIFFKDEQSGNMRNIFNISRSAPEANPLDITTGQVLPHAELDKLDELDELGPYEYFQDTKF